MEVNRLGDELNSLEKMLLADNCNNTFRYKRSLDKINFIKYNIVQQQSTMSIRTKEALYGITVVLAIVSTYVNKVIVTEYKNLLQMFSLYI
jgi:hypothetical protein